MIDPIQRRVHTAVSAALDKKASDLDVLQVSELTSIADYFIICSAGNERQAQAIADSVQEKLRSADSVKPLAKTASCEVPHLQYHVAGRLGVRMDDGTEAEFGPGDVSLLPPGHDAWVVGSEPVVVIDITGMVDYAKPS